MDWLPIETARLVLRRFGVEDLAGFQAYRSDPQLARYQGWEPVSDALALRFLRAQARAGLGERGEWLQIAIVRRDSGVLIGDLGLCVRDAARRVVEVGFTLARPAQGRGFASEALRALLDVLLGRGYFKAAIAVADARNAPSMALLSRTGFRCLRTSACVFRNEPAQRHTYALSATLHAARRRGRA